MIPLAASHWAPEMAPGLDAPANHSVWPGWVPTKQILSDFPEFSKILLLCHHHCGSCSAQNMKCAGMICSNPEFASSCSGLVQEERCHCPQGWLMATSKISLPSAQADASLKSESSLPAHAEGMCGIHWTGSLNSSGGRRIPKSWRWTGGGSFPFLVLNLPGWLLFSGVTVFTGMCDRAPWKGAFTKCFTAPQKSHQPNPNGPASHKCWVSRSPVETQQTWRCSTPLETPHLLCLVKKLRN